MKHSGFVRISKAKIFFTKEEIQGIMWLSAHHYDTRCRMAGIEGGFLFGLMNCYFEFEGVQCGEDYPHILDFNQVDTLAKITEPVIQHPRNMIQMHLSLMNVLKELNDEYIKNNPPANDGD